MRDRSGFTLIELMIVVAIVVVVSSITIPSLIGWIPNHRIRRSVDDLNTSLQLARMRAIRENANVVFQINNADTQVEVFVDNGGNPPVLGNAGNGTRDAGELILKLIDIPADVELYNATFANKRGGYNGRGFPLNLGQIHMKTKKGANNLYLGITMNIAGNARIIESKDNGSTWQ